MMMKCGHAANSVCDGKPCCVICLGIVPGADEVDDEPDLTGRKAKCGNHGLCDSHTGLAFFKHRPDREFDEYYCGCWGWD